MTDFFFILNPVTLLTIIKTVDVCLRLFYVMMIDLFCLLPSGARSCHCHHNGVCGFPGCHGDPRRVPHSLHSPSRRRCEGRL